MTLIGGSCWLNKGHPLETTTYKNLNKSWNCPWLRIWIFLWHRCIWSNILELWVRSHNLSQAGKKWHCGKKNIQNDTRTILSENSLFLTIVILSHKQTFEWKEFIFDYSYFEPQTFSLQTPSIAQILQMFLCTEVVLLNLKSVIHILHVNDSNVVFVAL